MTAPTRADQRRAFVIGLVGLGLVAVLFVGSRVVSGGDDDGGEPLAVPTTLPGGGPSDRRPADIEPGSLPPIPELPDSFEIVELRDPFESPLLNAALAAAPSEPGGGGGVTPTTVPDDGTVPPPSADPGARVEVIAVRDDGQGGLEGVFLVDGVQYVAGVGETFGPADEFEVLALDRDSQCALLRLGDEPFTPECPGEEVTNK